MISENAFVSIEFVEQCAFSFNGEPQAQAKWGDDACGLPLNDDIDRPLTFSFS
jgi:hypothetical protein